MAKAMAPSPQSSMCTRHPAVSLKSDTRLARLLVLLYSLMPSSPSLCPPICNAGHRPAGAVPSPRTPGRSRPRGASPNVAAPKQQPTDVDALFLDHDVLMYVSPPHCASPPSCAPMQQCICTLLTLTSLPFYICPSGTASGWQSGWESCCRTCWGPTRIRPGRGQPTMIGPRPQTTKAPPCTGAGVHKNARVQ